jgi:uncharacterized protein (TIGR03435 family)
MSRIFPSILLPLVTAHLVCAQEAPAFAVATVRLSEPTAAKGGRAARLTVSPDTLTVRNYSLKPCIAWAYHLTESQVSGPDWIDSERYDIVAKAPSAATEDQLRRMLQGLLAGRFNLTLHHQTKVLPTYTLSVAKNGPKVRESQTQGEPSLQPQLSTLTVVVQRASASLLVEMLSKYLRAPVVDRTGLTGRYDVTIQVAKLAGALQAGGGALDIEAAIMSGLQ